MLNENLRIQRCYNTHMEVVQVRIKKNGKVGWICCHNKNDKTGLEDDIHDVQELRKDPSGVYCEWKNGLLLLLQSITEDYDIINAFTLIESITIDTKLMETLELGSINLN